MPTVRLDVWTPAYPTISNRIQATVRSTVAPYPSIVGAIDAVAGHPERTWMFPGLPRQNYIFSLDEIDALDQPINNLALFQVSPSTVDGLLTRNDEQPQVDSVVGFTAGTNFFIFDGAMGKPNYIGWEIVPSEIGGRGILVRGLDYSWDKTLGRFDLLQVGDVFQTGQYYNIKFEPQQNPAGNSYPTITDFEINIITATTSLSASYFGKKLICEPAGNYMEVTLPDIGTVVDGRKIMVEVGGTGIRCVKFLPFGTDTIKWNKGRILALSGESFSVYKFSRPGGDPEWRLCDVDGNFKRVGETVFDDNVSADVVNKQLLDGSSLDKFQYARLYEELVLELPGSQVVDYDSWSTGNNKYLFSLANSSNPANANKFKIPDRRALSLKANKTGKAGDYESDQMKKFWTVAGGETPTILKINGQGTETSTDPGPTPNLKENVPIDISLFGDEVRVKSILNNQYVVL